MTAILLALLAAVGIGGGIAAVSGGGGDDAPQAPMAVISTLAEADRYKNVLAYSNDSYGGGLENIQFGSEKIIGQMEVPVVRDGFYMESVAHPYVVFTKDHYQKTDEYADYFTQKVGSKRMAFVYASLICLVCSVIFFFIPMDRSYMWLMVVVVMVLVMMVTCGMGSILAYPLSAYMTTATAAFYDDAANRQAAREVEFPSLNPDDYDPNGSAF